MTRLESLRQFDRRERVYALPTDGTPEEAVKAALKSWRNPERFRMSSGAESATGRALPLRETFALDVARLASRLSQPARAIVLLYFVARRPPHPRHAADDCQSCQQHYGNEQVAADMARYGYHLTARSVGQYKRAAVGQIAASLFPAYYRGRKARRGV